MSEHDGDASSQRSGNSGASGLSETSSQRSDSKFLKKRAHGIQQRNEEEADVLEQKRNFQDGVFACMYTLVRQTAMSHWKYAFLKIVLEFVMNFIVAFNPTFKVWRINTSNPVWQVIRWTVWRSPIMRLYGYDTYVVVMYVMAVAVLLSVMGLAWLTVAMRKQEQSKLLRVAALGLHVVFDIFYGICYVTFFDYFSFMADCDFLGTKTHLYFTGVECLAMPHLMHMLVGLSAGLLFLCVTALVIVASCDLDPVSRGVLASPAAYARLKILFAKAIFIIFANCLDSNFRVQVVGMLISTTLIVYWNLKTMPFYNNFTNVVWTGLWISVLHTVILLVVIAFGKGNSDAYYVQMTTFVLFGTIPVTLGGMVFTSVYVWWAMRPARKFVDLQPGVKLSKVHKFESVYEVERLARVMRKFDSDGMVTEKAAAHGETIIKAGLQTFPNAPHLLILYANFVLEVRKDGPAARTQLQLVGKQMPNLVERYQVFCTNEASKRLKDSQEGGMDLQAYIEFKRNLRAVLRVHKDVLLQQSELWQICMRSTLRVAQVDEALESLETASTRADQIYRRVLERYPANGKLLRCYGKFLEDVRHDQVAAARAYAGANRVGASNALLSLDFASGAHGSNNNGKPDFLTSMSMEDDAIVVIDAEGTIMMVSQAVQKAFGYSKAELEGANVAILMPQPFSQRHAGYMQRYTSTGEPHILDSVREVVALHKERYVFPIAMCVTKLSGVGTDSIFLGVIRPLPTSMSSVRAWLSPNGVILCADQQLSSAIGMLEGDLVGHAAVSLALDPHAVTVLLDRCQTATAAELESGDITTELTFHHRYLDPVPFHVEVRMAGSDEQRILVLHCRRTDGLDGGMLAVDTHMRIRFASCEVALLLGYSMRKLTSMRLDQLLPPPYNALHAKWLRDPPHSSRLGGCRTGAAVHLLSEMGAQIPVRLAIHTLEVGATAGASGAVPLYVVKIAKLAPDEVFREKRLVLTADFAGKVLSVSSPESAVFEFPALSFVGTNLADCVDIFADWRERSGEMQMQMILLALLGKEQDTPGTSWRVRVYEPQAPVTSDQQRGIAGTKASGPRRVSRSACLQVELQDDDDGAPEAGGVDVGVRVQVTLWRRDLLSGVVELDEELVIRRASPLMGLITGMSTTAMLRKPLSSFLNIPHDVSWEKLVAASAHDHHKKSALKATSNRGNISPVLAFIGPHPDSGTMRLMVQGVQTLGPGGRPKVTITMHPDTTFVGAHADLMRVLRLEGSYGGGGDVNLSCHGDDDDELSHPGRQTRVTSVAASAVRSRGANRDSLAMQPPGSLSAPPVTDGVQSAHHTVQGGDGGGLDGALVAEDDGVDDDEDGDDGDDDASDKGPNAQAASIHRQATSKSEFVEQWVRSITHQTTTQLDQPQQRRKKHRRDNKAVPGPDAAPTAAGSTADEALRRQESSLLALPFASPALASVAVTGEVAPSPHATSHLATVPKTPSPVMGNCPSGGGPSGAAALQDQIRAPAQPDAQGRHRRAVSRVLSLAITGPLPASSSGMQIQDTRGGQPPQALGGADGGAGKDDEQSDGDGDLEEERAKSDKASDADGSSADDGSQGTSAISSATDATSVSEVVIDMRRGRLLKALNKVLLGPALITHLNNLRLRSYALIATMFLTHLVAYIIITTLIKDQYKNVYMVHRQALAMDRSQLVVVRTVLGTFCERANVTAKEAGCAYPLHVSLSRLATNVLLMEEYHQGVYLGFDASRATQPARDVYDVWTTPNVDYKVFMDTTPAQVIIEQGGAWQIGNRFLAAAREAGYWMLQYKENFKFHRAFSFITSNGLGPLFAVYAMSLDYLVQAAWERTENLRQEVLIFMVVEALIIQICCVLYELYLLHRLEAARVLGMLAIVGLPGPVLRQLTAVETKVVNDSDDESDDDNSLAASDDNVRTLKGGGGCNGGSVKQSQQQQATATVSIAGVPAPPAPMQQGVAGTTGDLGAVPTNDSGKAAVLLGTSGEGLQGSPAVHAGSKEERGLGGRTLRAMRFQMSRKNRSGMDGAAAGSSSQHLHINGKTLLPSYTNLTKFMLPLLVWSLAVIAVYVVTLVELNNLQSPLASLNLASRITYRYTRLRAIGALFVSQDDAAAKSPWRPLLSDELKLFESEYNALMYGGNPSSIENSTFKHDVPAATFASSSFARVFFREKGCLRGDKTTCFKVGHEYYEITHNGLDAMVRRLIYELRLLSLDNDADVTYNSSRYAYTSTVGANDLYEGLQQASQLFVNFSISHYDQIIKMQTVLVVLSAALMVAYFFMLLWPHLARTTRDAARQSALLSLVPPEMDVRAHVRMVFKRGTLRKRMATGSKQEDLVTNPGGR